MAQKFLSGPFFTILVRLAGIEPTTPWFVAKYSIQLSYSRDRKEYISFARNGKAALFGNASLNHAAPTIRHPRAGEDPWQVTEVAGCSNARTRAMGPRRRGDGKKGSDISI
jgi:hypothetical protein